MSLSGKKVAIIGAALVGAYLIYRSFGSTGSMLTSAVAKDGGLGVKRFVDGPKAVVDQAKQSQIGSSAWWARVAGNQQVKS